MYPNGIFHLAHWLVLRRILLSSALGCHGWKASDNPGAPQHGPGVFFVWCAACKGMAARAVGEALATHAVSKGSSAYAFVKVFTVHAAAKFHDVSV